MSYFASLEQVASDPILGLNAAFKKDTRTHKVNLGVGAYQNSEGRPQVLASVRKAESLLLEKNLDKEYPPIQGNPDFISASLKLIFGNQCPLLKEGVVFGAQTIGGTGALRIGGEFLARTQPSHAIFFSEPTWPNHHSIFRRAGLHVNSYRYYDPMEHALDFSGMCQAIEEIPSGSSILLQPCCHNPTGIDLAFEEWEELSAQLKKRRLIPFFDLAYQGFDKGIEEDAKVVRYFAEQGHEMLLASSYSKNFGLYGERVGLLAVVCQSRDAAVKVEGQILQVIRGNYSMPPLHGQRIVTTILQSAELRNEWEQELSSMRKRIQEMRVELALGLAAEGEESFAFLNRQTGMFSFSGLSTEQVNRLLTEFAIYMPSNGRINVAGINRHNIKYVIQSLLTVSRKR